MSLQETFVPGTLRRALSLGSKQQVEGFQVESKLEKLHSKLEMLHRNSETFHSKVEKFRTTYFQLDGWVLNKKLFFEV